MRVRWWVAYAFLLPALLGLITFRLVPIGIALVGSFSGTTLRGETVYAGLANYQGLAADPTFWDSLGTTLLFNLIINPFQILCAFALALLVFRPSPGVVVFRTAFFLPMTVSIALTGILWMLMLDPALGPINAALQSLGLGRQPFFRSEDQALWTMIGIATWKGAGYWMLFLLAGLGAIPIDVYEAATIDGANGLRRFWHVTLPLMKRPLAFVLVADTALNFLFFAPVYIITNGGPNGATNLLMFEAYQAAFVYLDHGRSLAISTVILLVILVFAAAEFRVFRAAHETD